MQFTFTLALALLASAVAATPAPIADVSGPPVLFDGSGSISVINVTTSAILGCLDPYGAFVTTNNCGNFSTVGNSLYFLASGTDDFCGIDADETPSYVICDGSAEPTQFMVSTAVNGRLEWLDMYLG